MKERRGGYGAKTKGGIKKLFQMGKRGDGDREAEEISDEEVR